MTGPYRPSTDPIGFFNVVNESTRQLREEFASIGLLAAQVVVAAARVRDGEGLDPVDRRGIQTAARLFRSFAARIRFVSSGGVGEAPHTLLSTGVTNEVILSEVLPTDPEEVARSFDEIAGMLDQLVANNPTKDLATQLYERFSIIAERARVGAASSGHQPARHTTPQF